MLSNISDENFNSAVKICVLPGYLFVMHCCTLYKITSTGPLIPQWYKSSEPQRDKMYLRTF